MPTQATMNAIRRVFRYARVDADLTAAFEDDSYALFHATGGGISVVSGRRSKDPLRPRDMKAYAEALTAAGFVTESTYRDENMITLKVLP